MAVLTAKLKIKGKVKKTSAIFFNELQVGDVIELKYTVNGGYESAPFINIYKDGVYMHCNNATQLKNNLDKFEVEQIG